MLYNWTARPNMAAQREALERQLIKPENGSPLDNPLLPSSELLKTQQEVIRAVNTVLQSLGESAIDPQEDQSYNRVIRPRLKDETKMATIYEGFPGLRIFVSRIIFIAPHEDDLELDVYIDINTVELKRFLASNWVEISLDSLLKNKRNRFLAVRITAMGKITPRADITATTRGRLDKAKYSQSVGPMPSTGQEAVILVVLKKDGTLDLSGLSLSSGALDQVFDPANGRPRKVEAAEQAEEKVPPQKILRIIQDQINQQCGVAIDPRGLYLPGEETMIIEDGVPTDARQNLAGHVLAVGQSQTLQRDVGIRVEDAGDGTNAYITLYCLGLNGDFVDYSTLRQKNCVFTFISTGDRFTVVALEGLPENWRDLFDEEGKPIGDFVEIKTQRATPSKPPVPEHTVWQPGPAADTKTIRRIVEQPRVQAPLHSPATAEKGKPTGEGQKKAKDQEGPAQRKKRERVDERSRGRKTKEKKRLREGWIKKKRH